MPLGAQAVTREMLKNYALKFNKVYNPDDRASAAQIMTDFRNHEAAGGIDAQGNVIDIPAETQSALSEQQSEGLNLGERPTTPVLNQAGLNAMNTFESGGSENQLLTAGPVAGSTVTGALDMPYGNDLSQSKVQITDPTEPGLVNVTVPEETESQENVAPQYVHDESFNPAAKMGESQTIAGDQLSGMVGTNAPSMSSPAKDTQSIDGQAQEAVNNAKKEVDITFKQDKPTTLFGMAAEGLDKSGFTDWSKEKMGQSFDYGMGQFGNMSLQDNQPMWNKGTGEERGSINWGGVGDLAGDAWSGIKGGAGMMGAAMGGVGGMLSGALGALGSGLHAAGSAMSGQQQPRYGQGQQRFPQTQYSNFG